MLSAASSMLISPNRFREDCVSGYYGICTGVSACTTFVAYGFVASSGSGVFSSGGSGLLGWLGSPVAPVLPLLPLPDGMVLVPVLAPDDSSSLLERQLRGKQRPCVVSSSRDLSREGPFAASDAPSDTGVHPLVMDMLQGCPYRMTSYEPMNLADVDPVYYGLQLTHPRFPCRHVC